jgi:GntR family transcriptional regulator, transcriptional repressor for pyruvate dehydrogenase complex
LRFEPVRTQTRDRAVVAALAKYVTSAGVLPGGRLPPERVLAEQLEVSRATVREALKQWEGLGIVEMRKGSGTYLKRTISPDSVHVPLIVAGSDIASLLHALEVRRALEGEAAAICAERATREEVAHILDKLETMERAFVERGGRSADEDWEFHLTLIRTTRNPLFEQIIGAIHGLLHRFWEKPLGIADFGHASFPFHRTMVEAIARHDPTAARGEALKLIACTEYDLRRGVRALKGQWR